MEKLNFFGSFEKEKEEEKDVLAPDLEYVESKFMDRMDKVQAIADESDIFSWENGEKKRVWPQAGYFFLPKINPMTGPFKDEAEFAAAYQKAARNINPYGENEASKEDIELLAEMYKIHLMPKEEFTPFILRKVIKEIEDDPELKDLICEIKVTQGEDVRKNGGEGLPVIVIYPKLGKENAQKVLDKIYKCVGKYSDLAVGDEPRFNRKINDMVFYAQGEGGTKKRYKEGLAEMSGKEAADEGGIFEPDYVHFKGDYKLNDPSENEK
ncbi:MAG: hypothetical protein NT148_01365 [Candidatus Nealsonbacteria bacterium]|nr:hypothetical protein [Candidatus Nealsonbacteria bacterium]